MFAGGKPRRMPPLPDDIPFVRRGTGRSCIFAVRARFICPVASRSLFFPLIDHMVDQSPCAAFFRGHEIIPVESAFGFFVAASAMLRIKPRYALLRAQNFFGVDEDIRCLPLKSAQWLVNVEAGVGKRRPIAGFACHQQE